MPSLISRLINQCPRSYLSPRPDRVCARSIFVNTLRERQGLLGLWVVDDARDICWTIYIRALRVCSRPQQTQTYSILSLELAREISSRGPPGEYATEDTLSV